MCKREIGERGREWICLGRWRGQKSGRCAAVSFSLPFPADPRPRSRSLAHVGMRIMSCGADLRLGVCWHFLVMLVLVFFGDVGSCVFLVISLLVFLADLGVFLVTARTCWGWRWRTSTARTCASDPPSRTAFTSASPCMREGARESRVCASQLSGSRTGHHEDAEDGDEDFISTSISISLAR